MIDPNWIPGWRVVLVLALLMPVFAWVAATTWIRLRNQRLLPLRKSLQDPWFKSGGSFAVSGSKFDLFVRDALVAIVHVAHRRVERTYLEAEITGIKIHRRRDNIVDYRLLLMNGATTRE